MKSLFTASILALAISGFSQAYSYQLAILKYNGGGDWYANPTALSNLIMFTNQQLGTGIDPEYAVVEASSPDIFNYPLIHMTGHGNVVFNDQEIRNLKQYLEAGGFLHIDDNYGLDEHIRREMKKVFPEQEFQELSFNHPIYHTHYDFPNGLPKIHKHDGKPPQGFGLFSKDGRLVVFYTYETDLGDGWEPASVHDNPPEKRRTALQMGTNILAYAMMN